MESAASAPEVDLHCRPQCRCLVCSRSWPKTRWKHIQPLDKPPAARASRLHEDLACNEWSLKTTIVLSIKCLDSSCSSVKTWVTGKKRHPDKVARKKTCVTVTLADLCKVEYHFYIVRPRLSGLFLRPHLQERAYIGPMWLEALESTLNAWSHYSRGSHCSRADFREATVYLSTKSMSCHSSHCHAHLPTETFCQCSNHQCIA